MGVDSKTMDYNKLQKTLQYKQAAAFTVSDGKRNLCLRQVKEHCVIVNWRTSTEPISTAYSNLSIPSPLDGIVFDDYIGLHSIRCKSNLEGVSLQERQMTAKMVC